MAKDLNSQLQIQQQINKVIKTRSAMMKEQSAQLTGQAKLAKQLCKALECKGLEDLEDNLNSVNAELKKAAENAAKAEEEIGAMGDAADEAEKKAGGLTGKLGAIGGAIGGIKGITSVFKGFFNILKGAGKLIGSVVGGLFNIGRSIVSIPFGIYQGLLGMAQQGGGPSPIRLQLEEIRDSVGSLAKNEGAALRKSMLGARDSFRQLNLQGVRFGRVFGYGPEGVAEFGKALNQMATDLGSNMSMLTNETKKNQAALVIYQKALGLSGSQMSALAARASAAGQSFTEATTEVASMALGMEKRFNISSKLIAKDMGSMMEDFDNFGTLGPKVMASVAVYTRQLGIEVKALTGMIDKFDDFEGAAQSASKLAQSFGMNVDALKMMKEQDPAKRLSMMQKAFAATGKSVEGMHRSELKLLATSAGLDAKTAKLAFSQKGLGMSYEDVQAGAEEAKDKQLTQAEALKKLSDTIKKVFGSGQKQFKGFFDAFSQGFQTGIRRSKTFRQLMRNIRRSLQIMYRAGIKVGRAFVKFFPGVDKTVKGLRDLFDPRGFRKLADGMVKVFIDMFKDMQHDPKAGMERFMDRMKKLFKKFFSDRGPAVQAVREGSSVMLKALSHFWAGIIRGIKPMIADGLKFIADFIKDPSSAMAAAEASGSWMYEVFRPIFEAIVENEDPNNPNTVTGAFKLLMTNIWEKIGGPVMKAIKEFGEKFVIYALIGIVSKAVIGAIVGAGISKLISGMSASVAASTAVPTAAAGSGATLGAQLTSLSGIPASVAAKAAGTLTIMATLLLPAVLLYGYGAMKLAKMFQDEGVGWVATAQAMGSLYVMTMSLTAIIGAALVIDKMTAGGTEIRAIATAGLVIVAAGGIVFALGHLSAGVAQAFEGVSITAIGKMIGTTMSMLIPIGIVAAGAVALAKLPVDPVTMAQGALVIGAAGLVVSAIGYVGGLAANAMPQGLSQEKVTMFTGIIDSLIPMSIAAALGSAAMGALASATAGIGVALIAAGFLMLGVVVAGIAVATKKFAEYFSDMNISELQKASKAATVAQQVLDVAADGIVKSFKMGMLGMTASLVGLFTGNPIDKGFRMMRGFMGLMKDNIPPMMKDMLDAVKGADPGQAEAAVNLLQSIMKALSPMFELQGNVLRTAKTFAKRTPMGRDATTKVTSMFEKMADFVSGPAKELNKVITLVLQTSSNMDEGKIRAAEATAKLLASMGKAMNALSGPINTLMKNAVEQYSEGMIFKDTGTRFNAKAFKKGMAAMAEHLPAVVEGMGQATMDLTKKIGEFTITPGQVQNIEKFNSVMRPLGSALSTIAGSITELIEVFKVDFTKMQKSMGTTGTAGPKMIKELQKSVDAMTFLLFGGKKTGTEVVGAGRGAVMHKVSAETDGLMPVILAFAQGASAQFETLDKGMDRASVMRGAKAMSSIIGVVNQFVTMISRTLSMGGKMPATAQQSANAYRVHMKNVTEAIGPIATALAGFVEKMSTTIMAQMKKAIPSGTNLDTMTKKVKIFKDLLAVIDPLVNMMSTMTLIFKDKPKMPSFNPRTFSVIPQKEEEDRTAKATRFMEGVFKQLGGSLGDLIDVFVQKGGILDKIPYKKVYMYTQKAKALKGIFEAVGGIVEVLEMVSGMEGGGPTEGEVGFGVLLPRTAAEMMRDNLDNIVKAFGDKGQHVIPMLGMMGKVLPKLSGVKFDKDFDKKIGMIGTIMTFFDGDEFKDIAAGKNSALHPSGGRLIANHFEQMIVPLTAMNKVFYEMRTKMKSLMYYTKVETIEAAALKIVTLNGLFSGNDYRTQEAVAVFKTGQLEVKHSFPAMVEARVEVHVNLDSEKLAGEVAKVTFGNNLQLGTVGATTAPYAPAVGGYGMGG